MDLILEPGTTLRLDGQPGVSYQIGEVYGRGASCVAYRATRTIVETGETLECLVKEFNPRWLPMERDETGRLTAQDAQDKRFPEGLQRFKHGYDVQRDLYQHSETRNQTAIPLGFFPGNGTAYTVTALQSGRTYEKTSDQSIAETITTLIALSKLVGAYHDAEYLHLDIKPSNIFVFPESRNTIYLFDFDSIVNKSQLADTMLSCTQNWAAPELYRGQTKKICEATDIFSIGEILFFRVMGRHSERTERRSFSTYDFRESKLLENPDEKFCDALTQFFQKTLCVSVGQRWKYVGELLHALNELKALAERKFILRSSPNRQPNDFFIGREEDCRRLRDALHNKKPVFLCGMGGVGKSELAKNYAQHAVKNQEFDTVLFVRYSGSWSETIANDHAISIDNVKQEKGPGSTIRYAKKKMEWLKELCNSRVLFIVDNLDESDFSQEDNRIWEDIQGLNCVLLITSRLSVWEQYGKNVLHIAPFNDEEISLELFRRWCGFRQLDSRQERAARGIIRQLQGHPLAIEITAKQVAAGDDMPAELYKKLCSSGLKGTEQEPVRLEKDGQQLYQPGFDLIKTVLSTAELSNPQIQILQATALFPANDSDLFPKDGIDRETLKRICRLADNQEINSLCGKGWLSIQDKIVSIHPLISDVVLSENLDAGLVNRFYQDLTASVLNAEIAAEDPVFDKESCRYYIAVNYGQKAFEEIKRHFNDDHPSALCAKQHIGPLYLNWARHLLETDMYDYANWCLGKAKRCVGESAELHILQGNILYEMRPTLMDARNDPDYHQRAIAEYEMALADSGQIVPSEQKIEVLSRLGILHMELFQCDDAECRFKEAIACSSEEYGAVHEVTAECWCWLAELHNRYGAAETALHAFQTARDIYDTLGKDTSWFNELFSALDG